MDLLFAPTTLTPLLTTILVGAVIIVGIVYVFSSIRKQDLEVLRGSNEDLRAAIADKTNELTIVKTQMASVETMMATLQQRVLTLEKQNGDLQSLVKEALINYFQTNPNIAKQLQSTVEHQG